MRKYKWLIAVLVAVDVCLLGALGVFAVKWINTEKTGEIQTAQESMQNVNTEAPQNTDPENTGQGAESVQAQRSEATLKKLLQNAMKPVGETLYVYGGGWNKEDTGAGEAAVTIGVSPLWKSFYQSQGAGYDSSQYRYQIEKGLDCSGYVGWVIYNTLETENGRDGYVFLAQECADRYSQMGFGTKSPKGTFDDYLPGDILSSSSDYHVWIALGQCSDGSVVLVNSSPPGVRICGTVSSDGTSRSEAVKLAEKFMSEQFPDWYSKFPDCSKDMGYLTRYDRMRWDLSGNGVLTDPEGYSELTAEEVLTELFMG